VSFTLAVSVGLLPAASPEKDHAEEPEFTTLKLCVALKATETKRTRKTNIKNAFFALF
jgi:hypothetical protein